MLFRSVCGDRRGGGGGGYGSGGAAVVSEGGGKSLALFVSAFEADGSYVGLDTAVQQFYGQ